MRTVMSSTERYARPAEGVQWNVPGSFDTAFRWEYQDGRESLLKLYAKGKARQWDADTRIDWSQDLDPENPEQLPDESIPIFGSPCSTAYRAGEGECAGTSSRGSFAIPARRAGRADLHRQDRAAGAEHRRQVLRRHAGGRRGAPRRGVLAAAARQVRARLPDHADAEALLDNVLSDSRWDMTYLGMQVLIEGLALAAFAQIRDQSQNPLAAAVNAYVMQDEARHVAFGRFALRDYYPTAHAGRARRARGVRRRGLLPDARSFPGRRGLGDTRAAGGRVRSAHARVGIHAALPLARSSAASCR